MSNKTYMMLIDRLKPEYLEKLENAKEVYPKICKGLKNSLSNNVVVACISYGVFSEMRLIFGEQYSAYDYFI